MTERDLIKAKNIQREITQLENFIFVAEKVGRGKIINRTSKYVFQTIPYGVYNESEYTMDTEIKNRVLKVLRERLSELKSEFAKI